MDLQEKRFEIIKAAVTGLSSHQGKNEYNSRYIAMSAIEIADEVIRLLDIEAISRRAKKPG